MSTKLIETADNLLIEVEVPPDQARQISGGFAEKVNASIDAIKPMLLNACRPIIGAWQEISRDIQVDQVEVELGLSFEGEGNLYITKAKAGANLTIKLTLKPRKQAKNGG
jgi:hypothetical protein